MKVIRWLHPTDSHRMTQSKIAKSIIWIIVIRWLNYASIDRKNFFFWVTLQQKQCRTLTEMMLSVVEVLSVFVPLSCPLIYVIPVGTDLWSLQFETYAKPCQAYVTGTLQNWFWTENVILNNWHQTFPNPKFLMTDRDWIFHSFF